MSNSKNLTFDGVNMRIKDIEYNAPKANKTGKFIFTKKNIYVKLRNVKSFGASEFQGNDRFKLSIQLNDDTVLENVKAFEEELKKDVFQNSKQWLGKDVKSIDAIDAYVSSIVKNRKNDESPYMHIKLVKKHDKEWKFDIYDADRNIIYPSPKNDDVNPFDFINNNSDVDVMFQYNGFSIVNGKAHPSLTLYQMKLNTPLIDEEEKKCEL